MDVSLDGEEGYCKIIDCMKLIRNDDCMELNRTTSTTVQVPQPKRFEYI